MERVGAYTVVAVGDIACLLPQYGGWLPLLYSVTSAVSSTPIGELARRSLREPFTNSLRLMTST
jgi:hypothetical protein